MTKSIWVLLLFAATLGGFVFFYASQHAKIISVEADFANYHSYEKFTKQSFISESLKAQDQHAYRSHLASLLETHDHNPSFAGRHFLNAESKIEIDQSIESDFSIHRAKTISGDWVHFSLIHPKNMQPKGLVLSLHQTTFCNLEEPLGTCGFNNDYSKFFLEKGYTVVTPRVPGFQSENEGQPGSYNNIYNKWNQDLGGYGLLNVALLMKELMAELFVRKMTLSAHYTATGLSHGGIISAFLATVDTNVERVITVGGGFGFRCENAAWSQPIYFSDHYNRICDQISFGSLHALIFPRKQIILRAKGDQFGKLNPNDVVQLRRLYQDFGLENRLHIDLEMELSKADRIHRYDREVQLKVLEIMSEMDKGPSSPEI